MCTSVCREIVQTRENWPCPNNERIRQFVWWRWRLRVVHIMYTPKWVPRPNIRGDSHKWRLWGGQGDSDGSSYENDRIDRVVLWRWQLRETHIMHTPKWVPRPNIKGESRIWRSWGTRRLMPCPFTGPKMFWAGPNFLCQTKNLFTYCGSHKHFVPDKKMICIQ